MANELRPPPGVAEDRSDRELLRVWASDDVQHFALRVDEWNDPAAWGLLLVDIARHAARAYVQHHGGEVDDALARIKAGFDAEWAAPTDG